MNRGTLVITGNFDRPGGLQKQTRLLAAGLAERGEVTVLTWGGRHRPSVERLGRCLTLVRVPAAASWARRHRGAVEWANTAASALTASVTAVSRRRDYASILAMGLNPEGVVGAIVGSVLRKPFVLHAWVGLPWGGSVAMLERSFLAPLWRRLLSGANSFVAETAEGAEALAHFGFSTARIHVIPHGVDLDAFAPSGRGARDQAKLRLGIGTARVVLYHGRFDLRQKRLDVLLSAWRSAGLDGWRLVLAGHGPDFATISELASQLDPPAIVLGWQEDVRWLLSGADLAVLPTELEGTSGALAEAMAFGLPVLASDVPGHNRLRPAGVVLVPNEHVAWTSALVELAHDVNRRAELGSLARSWVEEHFDADRFISAYAALLATDGHVSETQRGPRR